MSEYFLQCPSIIPAGFPAIFSSALVGGTNLIPTTQTSLKFCHFSEVQDIKLKSGKFSNLFLYCALSDGVDIFSLIAYTGTCQKLKKPWRGLFPAIHILSEYRKMLPSSRNRAYQCWQRHFFRAPINCRLTLFSLGFFSSPSLGGRGRFCPPPPPPLQNFMSIKAVTMRLSG